MRVRSYMRGLRGRISLEEASRRTGIAKGWLSMFERGHAIPREDQLDGLRRVYGQPYHWYPAGVWNVLADDIRHCPGCGEELPPSAAKTRKYHDEDCRKRSRRENHGAA